MDRPSVFIVLKVTIDDAVRRITIAGTTATFVFLELRDAIFAAIASVNSAANIA
jgi:hypothetical protein